MAKKVMGFPKKTKYKEGITPRARAKIEERRKLKEKLLNTKWPRLMEQAQSAYKCRDREVKWSAWEEKRASIEGKASKVEKAALCGEISAVYKITKQFCRSSISQSLPMTDNKDNSILTERQQVGGTQSGPDDPMDPQPADTRLVFNKIKKNQEDQEEQPKKRLNLCHLSK